MKKVMLLVGAGQIGMAIARRVGTGMKIIVGDKKTENTENVAAILNNAGFDAFPVETDLSDRASIQSMIAKGQEYGEITMLVNAAGVSPSQAPIEAILKVDLYGTAVLLEEVGKVIASGGIGVTISSQSGWRMPALTAQQDEQLGSNSSPMMIFSIMLFNVALRFLGNPNPIVKCPCGSASTKTTFFPDFTSPAPKLIVVVVLATPPF